MLMEHNQDPGFQYAYILLRSDALSEDDLFKYIQELALCKASFGVVSQQKSTKATAEEAMLEAYRDVVAMELDNPLWKGLINSKFTIEKMMDSYWGGRRESQLDSTQRIAKDEKTKKLIKKNELLRSRGEQEIIEGKLSAE
jgi:hypothetical protein